MPTANPGDADSQAAAAAGAASCLGGARRRPAGTQETERSRKRLRRIRSEPEEGLWAPQAQPGSSDNPRHSPSPSAPGSVAQPGGPSDPETEEVPRKRPSETRGEAWEQRMAEFWAGRTPSTPSAPSARSAPSAPSGEKWEQQMAEFGAGRTPSAPSRPPAPSSPSAPLGPGHRRARGPPRTAARFPDSPRKHIVPRSAPSAVARRRGRPCAETTFQRQAGAEVSEWEALRHDCRAQSGQKRALLPFAPRLRALVEPGSSALVNLRVLDQAWYDQRAKVWRLRELADRRELLVKVLLKAKGAAKSPVEEAKQAAKQAQAAAESLEGKLRRLTAAEHSATYAELVAFGDASLRGAGLSKRDGGWGDADRAFRLLLARVLDVEPGLPALTPVTVVDALAVLYKAAQVEPEAWRSLLSLESSSGLKEMSAVVLHRDETLSAPSDMFADVVRSLPRTLVEPLLGVAAISYATMCSGTESPIMAMDLFSKACKELHGKPLNFSHRFSCEIDPVKQGYIYRNFGVRTLFRDIQELGQPEAHTAWNSKEPVPGAEVAVAGTSCVDFSSLNGVKKALDEQGESGDTFQGLIEWVKVHRPLLVVNENVLANGAKNPWPEMQHRLEEAGYAARFLTFDSKAYYVPQTRMRRYMLAINVADHGVELEGGVKLTREAAHGVLDDWREIVTAMQRPYTATLDHFLYPDDDPIVARARRQRELQCGRDADWTRSLMRNMAVREAQQLGDRRPLTRWDEAGNVAPADDADWAWWSAQPNRVKDVAEVCFLRCVAQGQDPRHKPFYMNLSQNPERNDRSGSRPGLCPCLTPCEIPLISSRGGSIIAQERLKLQALPVESLSFTRETERDLSSLAGNAMTATVVGPVILAAWMALVKAGYVRRPSAPPAASADALPAWALVPTLPPTAVPMPRGRANVGIAALCSRAAQSSALCASETGHELKGGIAACVRCRHSACGGVRGSPCGAESFMAPVHPRTHPSSFCRDLAAILPPCIRVEGLSSKALLQAAAPMEGPQVEAWAACCAASASTEGLVLYAIDRCRYHWRATWRDPSQAVQREGMRLELVIGAEGSGVGSRQLCEWRLFADAGRCGAQALRPLLRRHFAKCVPGSADLISGEWSVRLPEEPESTLTITGRRLGPSWERTLGLGFDDLAGRLKVNLSPNAWEELEVRAKPHSALRHVEGIYDRSPTCGAANGSLHIRRGTGEPLYLFREVDPIGYASADRFVIASTHEKLPLGVVREHFAVLPQGWLPLPERHEEEVRATRPGRWRGLPFAALRLPREAVSVSLPAAAPLFAGDPSAAQLVARISVPHVAPGGGIWGGAPCDMAGRGMEGPAGLLRWLRPVTASATDSFLKWQDLPAEEVGLRLAAGLSADDRVAPRFPAVQWVPHPRIGALMPQEQHEEAAVFERGRRTCPKPLSVFCRSPSRSSAWGRCKDCGKVKLFDLGAAKPACHCTAACAPTAIGLPSAWAPAAATQAEGAATSPLPTDERRGRAAGELLIGIRPQVVALQAAAALSAEVLDGTDRAALKLSFRIVPTRSVPAMATDTLWVTMPPERRYLRLGGRYNRRLAAGKADDSVYVREACGGASFVKRGKGVWQLLDAAGQVAAVSDGIQGAGVLPHQVQGWCGVEGAHKQQMDPRIVVEAQEQKTFALPGNDQDAPDPALPLDWNPRLPLWEMQQRSVGWLREQETRSPEYLQEACESFEVPSVGLRIEGRATMPTHGHRAVLADGVGFGKTAVVLARLCEKASAPQPGSFTVTGRLLAKATLVLVPAHLVTQWLSEAHKFITGRSLNTVRLDSAKDLCGLEVSRLLAADLVVVNFEVLQSRAYLQRLSYFATGGARPVHAQKGRHQAAMYQEVLEHMHRAGRAAQDTCAGMEVAMLERSRKKSFTELATAVAERNTTRKGMNEMRKKRRRGEGSTEVAAPLPDAPLPDASVGRLRPLYRADTGLLEMQNVPLELFEFARVVCDEVSFVTRHLATALSTGLRGRSHVCLTGTPGLDSARSVAQLARAVGMIIAPDEPPPEEVGRVKGEEQTTAESFRYFLRAPDELRYARQAERASQWLERFARHNEPNRAGIPVESRDVSVLLSPVEQVLYLEKDRELKGLDAAAVLRRVGGGPSCGARDRRLRAMLRHGSLQSVQEVLIYQASCTEMFDGTPEGMLAQVHGDRLRALEATKEEFQAKLEDLAARHGELMELVGLEGAETHGAEFEAFCRRRSLASTVGLDADLDDEVCGMVVRARRSPRRNDALWAKPGAALRGCRARPRLVRRPSSGTVAASSEDEDEDADEDAAEGASAAGGAKRPDQLHMEVKEGLNTQHGLNALLKEMGSRRKVLRFFDAISAGMLRPGAKVPDDVTGARAPARGMVVLPCGHVGLPASFAQRVREEGRCAVEGCSQENVHLDEVVHLRELARAGTGGAAEECEGPFGSKLAVVARRLRRVLAQDATNRALVFCQLPVLMDRLREALAHAQQGVPVELLEGTPQAMHEAVERFSSSEGEDPRVLLLSLDERCSGVNLTSANHVLFVHPVLRSGPRSAADIEAQAIGRARRFGQKRTVHVWRFVAKNTLEEQLQAANLIERRE